MNFSNLFGNKKVQLYAGVGALCAGALCGGYFLYKSWPSQSRDEAEAAAERLVGTDDGGDDGAIVFRAPPSSGLSSSAMLTAAHCLGGVLSWKQEWKIKDEMYKLWFPSWADDTEKRAKVIEYYESNDVAILEPVEPASVVSYTTNVQQYLAQWLCSAVSPGDRLFFLASPWGGRKERTGPGTVFSHHGGRVCGVRKEASKPSTLLIEGVVVHGSSGGPVYYQTGFGNVLYGVVTHMVCGSSGDDDNDDDDDDDDDDESSPEVDVSYTGLGVVVVLDAFLRLLHDQDKFEDSIPTLQGAGDDETRLAMGKGGKNGKYGKKGKYGKNDKFAENRREKKHTEKKFAFYRKPVFMKYNRDKIETNLPLTEYLKMCYTFDFHHGLKTSMRNSFWFDGNGNNPDLEKELEHHFFLRYINLNGREKIATWNASAFLESNLKGEEWADGERDAWVSEEIGRVLLRLDTIRNRKIEKNISDDDLCQPNNYEHFFPDDPPKEEEVGDDNLPELEEVGDDDLPDEEEEDD